jgi:hypothetical protein
MSEEAFKMIFRILAVGLLIAGLVFIASSRKPEKTSTGIEPVRIYPPMGHDE